MPTPSDNHGFDLEYELGDEWSYNEEFAALEERTPVVDVEANLDAYTPHDDALYIASDTGALFVGDGVSWHERTLGDESTWGGYELVIDDETPNTSNYIRFETQSG